MNASWTEGDTLPLLFLSAPGPATVRFPMYF